MTIYVSSSVTVKLDEYVEFLMRTYHYSIDEAETRRWEVEYQVNQHCNPILMKSGSSGTIKFKSVLQRQEIERFVNNRLQLMRIIKRRKGNRGNTQWNVDYIVSTGGDVFITAIKCYNTFSESLTYQGLQQIINECVDRCLKKYLNKMSLNESHCVRIWHYTSFDQAVSIIKSNKFKLRQNDDTTDECKYKHTGVWYDEYGEVTTPPKYMLCATRIRDSRVGFSSSFQYGFITEGWGFARFELDENAIEFSPQLTVRTEKDAINHRPHIKDFNTKRWNYRDKRYGYYTDNWENQHEERILSKTPVIDNALQYIRRIDFLIKDKTELETLKDILKKKRIYTNKVFIYTNMKDFNAANDNFVDLT